MSRVQPRYFAILLLCVALCEITQSQHRNNAVKLHTNVLVHPVDPLTTQTPPPRLSIVVDKSALQTGEVAKFTLEPRDVVKISRFILSIDFGDGTHSEVAKDTPEVLHFYRKAKTFTASLKISTPNGQDITGQIPTSIKEIKVVVSRFGLTADLHKTRVGQKVSFQVKPVSPDPKIRYLFNFGDGVRGEEWTDKAQVEHEYSSAQVFNPSVTIGRLNDDQSIESIDVVKIKPITVSASEKPPPPPTPEPVKPTPTPKPLITTQIVAVGGVAILLILFLLLIYALWPSKINDPEPPTPNPNPIPTPTPTVPEFKPRWDPDDPKIRSYSKSIIDYQVITDPAISQLIANIASHGNKLIRSIRRENV